MIFIHHFVALFKYIFFTFWKVIADLKKVLVWKLISRRLHWIRSFSTHHFPFKTKLTSRFFVQNIATVTSEAEFYFYAKERSTSTCKWAFIKSLFHRCPIFPKRSVLKPLLSCNYEMLIFCFSIRNYDQHICLDDMALYGCIIQTNSHASPPSSMVVFVQIDSIFTYCR